MEFRLTMYANRVKVQRRVRNSRDLFSRVVPRKEEGAREDRRIRSVDVDRPDVSIQLKRAAPSRRFSDF